ncbi:MAG: hypothetical protein DCF21_18915 [Leptolyngbya sp.]|uniref:Uncharacterized protein n=1 Tax=Shackletoniella antarctica TaxID=268115 RepID=A0A2W4VQ71_9CYAN|nr:MAG: hypothetical protein DCF17_21710 [Shackletoniella antarctica]PZV10046.1 MAG: hypothetical protein DCF21_18915 [Leptolyngbya sp.]
MHFISVNDTELLELALKRPSYPNPDGQRPTLRGQREPVKILVIGSKRSLSSIVVALHQLGFAEIFEWTDFLSAPNADHPLQFGPDEVMKALVKYIPRAQEH